MYTVPKLEDYSPAAIDTAVSQLRNAVRHECMYLLANAISERKGKGSGAKIDTKPFRDRWLGRKNGLLTQVGDLWLGKAPRESKRDVGLIVNELKQEIPATIEKVIEAAETISEIPTAKLGADEVLAIEAISAIPEAQFGAFWDKIEIESLKRLYSPAESRLEQERLDITLPGIERPLGAEHPVIRTMNKITSVFRAMGYSIGEGPEIESDYYNFESLNFPPNHPARDTQDTIFISGQEHRPQRDRLLLRTHTSPVQIRTMEKQKPPVRIVIPGKVHRNDAPDASHSPMFHQVEGLAVDEGITFCDLKGTIDHAMKAFFGSQVRTRFQPSFFPFTEPSAEVSISCIFCGGSGCRVCKQSGWIELLGCGMVDPALYNFVGYDASKVSGFAFGMGVERIAMLMYGVDDIQLFYQGDVRFLEQFA